MRERERELIAALAEGSLEDETEARALLEASPEARAEYQLQRHALEALSTASPTEMTDLERARLHGELWTRLRAEKAKTRSTVGIYGWSLAAAALFVVVGLAAVLGGGLLGGQGAATDTFEEIASGLSDTTAAAEMATEETQAGEEAEAFAAGDSESAAVTEEAQDYFEEEATRLRSDESLGRAADGGDEDSGCLERAELFDHEVVDVVGEDPAALVEGRYLAAVPAGAEIEPATPIHFVDSDTCELVYTAG
ncbi:MAG: hypothetical protein KY394_01345 [Actinobacteria bacterium]|nr:hypothetical protein [Actinomycetota bacterium]